MKSKLTFLTLIVLTFYKSSFAQCPANGFTCSVTYTDTNPAPEIIDRQNGGYVCIESGTHNLKGLVINENSGNNGICIGDRAVVTLKAPSSEFKPNGNWSIHGDFIYDSNTTDRFFLTKGPFYISTTGSFTGTNVEFVKGSDNLNLGANKLIIDGTLTARQLDNHGPATINGSVILESFDSHNKGSQPFIINCSITINPNDASDIVTVADQNIRGTGDFIVNGTLNVPSSNVTFVGDSPTEVLNVVYDNFTGNTNAFGANTTRNAPTGNTTC